MDITKIQSAYFIGIKGVGMAAFAQILRGRGVAVSGSDTTEIFFTDDVLRSLNIPFTEGFSADNVPSDVDIVITSPAYINTDNPEILRVKELGKELITWHDGLAQFFNAGFGIAVCGTHGKSTTTAMLGTILEQAGMDPTVMVGSRVNAWNSNARVGKSDYFVIEADEYREAFLHYSPKMIVVTNIEYDHPDYFPTVESYEAAFAEFTGRVTRENLIHTPSELVPFALKFPGEHNQKNANAAYRAALCLGVDADIARSALEGFSGLARRFEYVGEYRGMPLYDDYAHHPTEITALLQGAREQFSDKKISVLFQPHTFSRTERLFDEFVTALSRADSVAILRTYGSARESGEDTIGQKLAQALNAPYFSHHEEAAAYFADNASEHSVLFSVGAGDGWQVLRALKK